MHISYSSFVDILNECYGKNTDGIYFSSVIKDSSPDNVSYCVFITIVGYRPCIYTKCER